MIYDLLVTTEVFKVSTLTIKITIQFYYLILYTDKELDERRLSDLSRNSLGNLCIELDLLYDSFAQ
jgi:hypothetical protein